MSDLILAVYASPSDAFTAGQALAVLQQKARTEPEDIVVVTRDAAGRVSVNQLIDRGSGRPLGGGSWGTLIGMLFLDGRNPGGPGTGLAAQFHAAGLQTEFLQEAFQTLTPGSAVVGLRVRLLGADRVLEQLQALPGKPRVLRQRLAADVEEALYDLQGQIPEAVLDRGAPEGMF